MITEKIKFRAARCEDRAELSSLWQEAFSEGEEFFTLFFENGFLPENSLCAEINGKIAAVLYWFDFFYREKPIAYIYGVATLMKFRGCGIGTRLMNEAQSIIKNRGYSGVILLPAKSELYSFYDKLGYKIATKVSKFTANASEMPAKIEIVSPKRYVEICKKYLPERCVLIGERAQEFLGAQYILVEGEDFVLSGYKIKDKLIASEFLGNKASASGALRALGCERGEFRTAGEDEFFAMYLAFTEDAAPEYLGIVFD